MVFPANSSLARNRLPHGHSTMTGMTFPGKWRCDARQVRLSSAPHMQDSLCAGGTEGQDSGKTCRIEHSIVVY